MIYNGIEIDTTNKGRLSHSRILETNKDADYLDILGQQKVYADAPTKEGRQLFREVSRVFSVASRNYQICNGGISQYYCNGYNESHAPYEDGDCARYSRSSQLNFIKGTLDEFARQVLSEEDYAAYYNYTVISSMPSKGYSARMDIKRRFGVQFDQHYKMNERDYRHRQYLYDDIWSYTYYMFNDVFEQVLEYYAQYLVKKYDLKAKE